jgi:predicted benzoate:H+ symporter BenE
MPTAALDSRDTPNPVSPGTAPARRRSASLAACGRDLNPAAVSAGLTAFAGAVIVLVGRLGIGGRLLAVLPLPIAMGGITSAFWALLAGLVASLVAERGEFLAGSP